jgi:hypothetical protein
MTNIIKYTCFLSNQIYPTKKNWCVRIFEVNTSSLKLLWLLDEKIINNFQCTCWGTYLLKLSISSPIKKLLKFLSEYMTLLKVQLIKE